MKVQNGKIELCTIGYGNRKFEDFVSLLKKHKIDTVVDVRRFPKSRHPEYVKESLEQELPNFGIRYVFMGDMLGGFRGGYQKYTETRTYRDGIKRLLKLARTRNVVIMCLERSPKGCHRRHISKTLKNLDVRVLHIIKDDTVLEEK